MEYAFGSKDAFAQSPSYLSHFLVFSWQIPMQQAWVPCQISWHIVLWHISYVAYAADIFINITGVINTSRFMDTTIARSLVIDPNQISCHIVLWHISYVAYAVDIFIYITGFIITSRFLGGGSAYWWTKYVEIGDWAFGTIVIISWYLVKIVWLVVTWNTLCPRWKNLQVQCTCSEIYNFSCFFNNILDLTL